ncbi:MAG: hypothetical protein E6392_08540, partial [Staphylococcus epidermidis]|nr:hypothetical protein [Staphylococcus epidermidis]
ETFDDVSDINHILLFYISTFLFKSQLTSVIIYTTLLNNKTLFVKLNPLVVVHDIQLYLYDIKSENFSTTAMS